MMLLVLKNKVKRSIRWAFSLLDDNIAENSNEDE
jgi:hypothetical protein